MADDAPVATPEPAAETPPAPETDAGSLSEHETEFPAQPRHAPRPSPKPVAEPVPAADAEPTAEATTDGERDDKGQFKPRQRARSQQAGPADVPRINELTAKLRAAEAERDALKQQRQTQSAAPAMPALPAPGVPAVEAPAFPDFATWLAYPGNAEKPYEDYIESRLDYREQVRNHHRQQFEAQQTFAQRLQTHDQRLAAAREKYPDFDQKVNPQANPLPASPVMAEAILSSAQSRDLEYWLATHPDECRALAEETAQAHVSTVPVLRRYLESKIVASEQRPFPTPAPVAAATGSAPAPLKTPAPRPPNPVRTGALKTGDEPPGDDSSLADHEQHYWKPSRRAR